MAVLSHQHVGTGRAKSAPSPLQEYLRGGYRKVDGFLTPGAIQLIVALAREQERLGIGGNVGEIGVHQGRAFLLLHLLSRSAERSLAVDVFEHQELNVDGSGRGVRELFERNLARHGTDTGRVDVIAGDSTLLSSADLEAAVGGRFRLFHIDGGHTAAIAGHDMATVAGALAPGGVIIVDDYFHEQWPGVSDGVRAYFAAHPESGLVPFAIGGNKVLFCERPYAAGYREVLGRLRVRGHSKASVMYGEPVLCFVWWRMGPKDRFIRTDLWRKMRGNPVILRARNWRRRRKGFAPAEV